MNIFFFVLCSSVFLFSCQKGQLSKREKTEDFLYLYETLEANYGYFDLAKRKSGVDWLSKREEYLKKVQSTPNDTAYIRTLQAILDALQDGHTDLYPTLNYCFYLDGLSQIAKENPEYKPWLKALEKDSTRTWYWNSILGLESLEHTSEIRSGYNDTIFQDKGIAVMNIPSFNRELIALDSAKIDKFFSRVHEADKLIINIQRNSGGSTHYWQKMIVPRLINDTIKFPFYMAIKKGAINREYFAQYFEPGYEISKEDPFYSKIPDYYLDNSFLIAKQTIEIAPHNPVNFKGLIYLLVDGSVFSASESFAYFSQITNWAVVAGLPTGGDGIGRDPIVISLPKSGIKVRFVVTAGFNANGELNAEKGTTPDHLIFGKSERERLENLIREVTATDL